MATNEDFLRYQEFVNSRLLVDLQKVLEQRSKRDAELTALDDLTTNLISLITSGQEEMHSMVDLGGEVLMAARVPDTSRVFVACGLGFHVECTPQEAVDHVVPLRAAEVRRRADALSKHAAALKAQIRFVQEGLRELAQTAGAGGTAAAT